MRQPGTLLLAAALAAAASPARAGETPPPESVAGVAVGAAARARAAAAALKSYTDQFRVPQGSAFPAPPPIPVFTARQVAAPAFFRQTPFADFKSCLSSYRALFDWWEEGEFGGPSGAGAACFAEDVHLDPERFQVAYGQATKWGEDKAAGARWVCGLADALRGYFGFYNQLEGGDAGGEVSRALWGVGTAPVDRVHQLNGWISARYKEASGVDLGQGEGNALNYATLERCAERVEETTREQQPDRPKQPIRSLMHKEEPEQAFFADDLSDVDFARWDYWVFYYDASWQPWGVVAATSKKWKNTPESFKRFVLCRAPLWVGNFVSRAPKNAKYQLRYFPKDGVTLRHRLQPAKASLRDQDLIARHRRRYCR